MVLAKILSELLDPNIKDSYIPELPNQSSLTEDETKLLNMGSIL